MRYIPSPLIYFIWPQDIALQQLVEGDQASAFDRDPSNVRNYFYRARWRRGGTY